MQDNLTRAELLRDTGAFTEVESGPADPRFAHWGTRDMASSFADLLKDGGDAFLWALIRIGLEEASAKSLLSFAKAGASWSGCRGARPSSEGLNDASAARACNARERAQTGPGQLDSSWRGPPETPVGACC